MTIRDIGILFGYKVDQASEKKVEGSIKSLKSMASKVLGAVGITLSVAGIKNAIDGCVEVASSIEEMQNKFDVVFGDMRDEVDKWAQEYSDAIGRNKNDIKTYLADQQNLLVGFGMTRQAGAEMAEQMTSLALDLASFGNMDETASVNAMTKAVMGESEAAKTLGAVLNDSTRAQAMATLGLKGTYDKLDQLTKMQVNYQAILQQSPDAIGDCQRSLDSYESTKKRYIAKLKEIKTIVGQFFLPTYQKILSIGAKGLTMIRDWLQKLTDLTDKLGSSQRVLAILTAAFTAMLVAMNLKKIGAAITGFTKLARAIGLGHGKAHMDSEYDFSFSGLKSSVLNYINGCKMKGESYNPADIAASFQKAVVEVLVENSMHAVEKYGMNKFAIAGGVASNSALRQAMQEACEKRGVKFYHPSPIFCTDNAAMIGVAAYYEYLAGTRHGLDLNAVPNLKLGER